MYECMCVDNTWTLFYEFSLSLSLSLSPSLSLSHYLVGSATHTLILDLLVQPLRADERHRVCQLARHLFLSVCFLSGVA